MRVMCIDPGYGNSLKNGNIYECRTDLSNVVTLVKDDNGAYATYLSERFVAVPEDADKSTYKQKFYVNWSHQGHTFDSIEAARDYISKQTSPVDYSISRLVETPKLTFETVG